MRSLLFLVSLSMCACDSPMNHRIREGENMIQKQQAKTFSKIDYQLEVLWLENPSGNIQKQNSLLVILKNNQGELTDLPINMTLAFYASMPSMGHPLDTPGDFVRLSEGVYLNSQIRYNMDGDWQNELWVLDENLELVDKVIWSEFL